MLSGHLSAQLVLFLILYGITGAAAFIAALYLLLRRGNAFAADVTPPLPLRRWAASFFAVSALGHVWWGVFYLLSVQHLSSDDLFCSVGYVAIVMLDCVTLLTTIAGTLLAMLQDRKRPVWPVFAAMTPFVAMGGVLMVRPSHQLMLTVIAYILLLYVAFAIYVAFAVKQYGRWLRDNFADLQRKEVWLSQALSLVFMLLFILYALVDSNIVLIYLLHFLELVLYGFLLWRVETLPQLDDCSLAPEPSPKQENQGEVPFSIEQLLAEHCVATQLYLQHDLTLMQLAKALGTNRTYLSQYFVDKGINYNTYINDLRISHFVSRYSEAQRNGRSVTAQKLAQESGYRSYSTFSLAFKQRMGQSVTAWMRKVSQ